MTPAIEALETLGCRFTLHLYASSTSTGYGNSAAEKLALDPDQVFKTLVVEMEGQEAAIALVPVSNQLNLKRLAKCAGAKKAKLMETDRAEKLTGYVIGGICPIGLKQSLPIYADTSITSFGNIFISGGKRGLELEIGSKDLVTITNATLSAIAD